MLRQIMLALGALGLIAASMPSAPAPAPEAKGRIRALVIGVVNYKDGIASPMIGAFNDSVLIAETLIREGAKAEDVTLLLDPPTPELLAARGNPRMRQTKVKPDAVGTRANILAAMKRIVDTTKPGDELLLAFSGHGMQQNEAVAGSEPDGLDEVFLPYDTGPANGSEKIENAVTDDEIGAVIDAIRAKGGNVTYIADFCHSGDSNRDAAGKDNGAPTSTKLGLKVSRKFATVSDGNFVRDLAVETSKGKAGWGAYVGLLAVPSAQQAKQYQAPRYADPLEQAAHGLLTVYAMANWNNPRVYSYRDLANRITAGIDGHKSPRPEFDGDLDRPVMGGLMKTAVAAAGGGSWAVYKPARVFTAETKSTDPVKLEQLEMSAGQLQGVVEGTIIGLALTSPAGDKTILYGRVDQADAYKAILVPTAFGDIAAEAWNDVRDIDGKPLSREVRLVATIEQQPVQLDYRIALPTAPASPSKAQAAALAALKEIKPADIGASFVQPGEAADLMLAFNGDKLALTQPPGQVTADFGSIDLAAALAQDGSNPTIRVRFAIGGALVKATRFSRLQRVLASPALATGESGEDPAKNVSVEFYVGRPKALAAGAPCPDTSADFYAVDKDARRVGGDGSEAGGFRFQRCDWLFVKVTNTGKTDLYVNPLIFSPDGGVLLFDGQDGRYKIKADNPTRLRAGESGVLQYSLTDASPGGDLRDDLVLLVSDVTDGVPLSYARLAQCPVVPGPEDGAACASAAGPTLAGTRMRNNGGAGTGIEELIDAALVGSTTRSGPAKKPTAVSALRFSWQTERTGGQ
ncbi:caspase family protein [Sphingomonas sp. R647]|uniref:caspase family protein n=1 Tax=Sphingomonas sp. R647 TaxID=2875233 RepID=UPI001CD2CB3C|nr:caspase family protein [Sphingomonas sp. R647]MCA1199601.1 caspase family protein [Sphingomonas sp. R647]